MTSPFITNGAAFSSNDNTWTTPLDFFRLLDDEFGFVLDAAALSTSALCDEWYGPDHPDPERRDALVRDWAKDVDGRGSIFLNPPYGRTIGKWMEKANETSLQGQTVVCLVPSRTDTAWWHDYCYHHEFRFVRGRLRFSNKGSAPFPSVVVVMK